MPIQIHFHKGGFVVVKPTGYEGSTCHEATRPYEERLGGHQTVEEVKDEEASTRTSTKQNQKAGN
jgi:hypothetical protein